MNIPAPFSENQMRFFWDCFDHWFNVAEGGKRGGKNVLITMAYCTILEKHPSRIHLIAGVSTATARLNILDCDGFGLKNYFEGRCREGVYQNRDCLYIQTATGEKVVLISGGGKAGDEKLIKGNTYGTAYITEANECSKIFIQEVFDRTLSSPDRKIFHDLNPKAEAHWYYQDVLNFHEEKLKANPKYGLNYGHFTIADNMSISDDQLRAVLSTYDRKSVWYARDILGQRKMAEGLVYPMFSMEKHVVKSAIPYSSRHRYYVSIDYGTVNPFAAGLWDFDPVSHKAIMIRELYYRGGSANRTDNEGYYRLLKKLIGDIKIEYIIIDPSASSMIETIEKYAEWLVVRADNDVLNGIQDVTKYLNMGLLLFHESCKETFKEFDQYSWDEESGEDAVIKEFDHSMDMIRYFCRTALRAELKYIA
jgi:PBSX family phage terminase large subunit